MSAESASPERVLRAAASSWSSTMVLILTRAMPRLYHMYGMPPGEAAGPECAGAAEASQDVRAAAPVVTVARAPGAVSAVATRSCTERAYEGRVPFSSMHMTIARAGAIPAPAGQT
jgi:hypothetical protein